MPMGPVILRYAMLATDFSAEPLLKMNILKDDWFDYEEASSDSGLDMQLPMAANASSSRLGAPQQAGHHPITPLTGGQTHLGTQHPRTWPSSLPFPPDFFQSHLPPAPRSHYNPTAYNHGVPSLHPDDLFHTHGTVNPGLFWHPRAPSISAPGANTPVHMHDLPEPMRVATSSSSHMNTNAMPQNEERSKKRKRNSHSNLSSNSSQRKRRHRDGVQEGPSNIPLQRSSSPEDAQHLIPNLGIRHISPHPMPMPARSLTHQLLPSTTRKRKTSSSEPGELPTRSTRQQTGPSPVERFMNEVIPPHRERDQMGNGHGSENIGTTGRVLRSRKMVDYTSNGMPKGWEEPDAKQSSNSRRAQRRPGLARGKALSLEGHFELNEQSCSCGKKFTRPGDRKRHLTSLHDVKKGTNPHCPVCKKGFSRPDAVKRHMCEAAENDQKHKDAYFDEYDELPVGSRPAQKKGGKKTSKKEDQSREKE